MKILVFRPDQLGDVILATPVFENLKNKIQEDEKMIKDLGDIMDNASIDGYKWSDEMKLAVEYYKNMLEDFENLWDLYEKEKMKEKELKEKTKINNLNKSKNDIELQKETTINN